VGVRSIEASAAQCAEARGLAVLHLSRTRQKFGPPSAPQQAALADACQRWTTRSPTPCAAPLTPGSGGRNVLCNSFSA